MVTKVKRIRKFTVGKAIKQLYLWFNILFMLFPLYFMFLSAFKTNKEIEVTPFAFPTDISVIGKNASNVFSGTVNKLPMLTPFITMLTNTFIITLGGLVVLLITATLCSYALGRLNFKGKYFVIAFILFIQIVPFFGYITPMYIIMDKIHFTNNLAGIIFIYVAVSLPASVVLMLGFFRSFPKAVEEAALIDGCNEFKKFVFIVMPMSLGVIGSMAVINFMGFWNEFAIASLLLQKNDLYTINMGVFALNSQMGGTGKKDYIMTLLTLSAIPNLIFFSLLQKTIVNGISLGAVKG